MNPVTDFLNAHLARVDAQLEKISKVATDIRQADADERAEDERRYFARKEAHDEERARDVREERRRDGA